MNCTAIQPTSTRTCIDFLIQLNNLACMHADKKNVPVTGPPKTVMESEDNDISSDALIQEDEVGKYYIVHVYMV